ETFPGKIIAFWFNDQDIKIFENSEDGTSGKKGILTGKDAVFKRFWFEIKLQNILFNVTDSKKLIVEKAWIPTTGGGKFRKWFGNLEDIINMSRNGKLISETSKNYRLRDSEYYFKDAITWTEVTSGKPSARIVPKGVLFGNGGPIAFNKTSNLFLLGLVNSAVGQRYLSAIAPTLNLGPEQIEKLPIITRENDLKRIKKHVELLIHLSKKDWNAFETSWEFSIHPMLQNIDEHNRNWNGFLKQNHCNVPILSQIIFLEEYYG
ncbi:restriction endonuclease, partial [Weissella confusa]|nr:restriction endonuclease [Weissella confusa]